MPNLSTFISNLLHMKTFLILTIFALLSLSPQPVTAQKKAKPTPIPVLIHTFPIHWYLDASSKDPAAFLDFYNGVAYTQAEAQSHASSVDAFCYDRSHQV